jgi:hypothetical protein
MKRDPTIPVFPPTLKRVKAEGKADGLIYSMDPRSILDIVNRKGKKPSRARKRISEKYRDRG